MIILISVLILKLFIKMFVMVILSLCGRRTYLHVNYEVSDVFTKVKLYNI